MLGSFTFCWTAKSFFCFLASNNSLSVFCKFLKFSK
jgi:hypothetical protein